MSRAGDVERLPGFPLGKGPNAMSRIKQLRQSAAQQVAGQGQPTAPHLEDLDEDQQAPQPADEAAPAEAPAGDVPAPTESGSEAAASDDAAHGTGSRRLVIGGVALGAIGLVGAASGGGGKSGDWKPPVAEVPKPEVPKPEVPEPQPEKPKPDEQQPQPEAPKPEVPQPQPETPKPDEQHPQPEAPKPEVPQPQPEAPKPDEQHPQPETPKPDVPQPQPEAPKPDEQQPQPEAPKPDVEPPTPEQPGKPETPVNPNPDTPSTPEPEEPTTPTPQGPPVPTVALTVDSGRSASDRYTNRADVTVTGLLPNASWKYSLDGGKTWVNGNVEGTIAASEFASGDGNKSVSVIQIDDAGNVSEPATLDFILDTTKPETTYAGLRPIDDNGLDLEFYPTTTIAEFDRADLLQRGLSIQWSCFGDVWRDVNMEDGPGFFTFDFYEGLSASVDRIYLEYRFVDQAGNIADDRRGEYFNGVAKLAPPPIPTVELRSDSGVSGDDRVTNDATLRVKGLVAGMTWKYSLDNGVTWKTGGADHQIAASEFGGIPGLKNVQVVQVNASNKESAATHFDFTLQPEDISGVHGATNSDPTLFTGTGGMDKFKVNAADGKKLSIVGYDKSQGDVLDLSAVLTIPDGANVSDYLRGMGAASPNSGYHFSVNTTGNPSVDPQDLLLVDLGIHATQLQVTILYNGGQTVI